MGLKRGKKYINLFCIALLLIIFTKIALAQPSHNLIINSTDTQINYLDNSTFNILFSHNDTETVEDLIFNNTLPSGWGYISDSWSVTGNTSFVSLQVTPQNLIFSTESLNGDSTINITFEAFSGCSPVNGTNNTVNVTYQWQDEGIPQANVSVINSSEQITVNAPALLLTYAPLPQVSNVNESDSWQVLLVNNGTGTANGIFVNHNLETGFSSPSFTAFTNGTESFSGTGYNNNLSVNWSLNILPGKTWYTTIYGTPFTCDENLLDFNVSITAGNGQCSYYTNTTLGESNLRRVRVLRADYSAEIGQNKSQTIHVNVDCDSYKNFTLTESLASVQQIRIKNVTSTNNGLAVDHSIDGSTINWFFYDGTGANFSSPFDFWITYEAYLSTDESNTEGVSVENGFSASYYNNTQNYFNYFYDSNTAESTTTSSGIYTTVLEPSLTITKVASDSVVSINETFDYVIDILNEGLGTAHNITLTDVMPDGTLFIESTESLESEDGRNLEWNIPTISSSGSWSTTVTARVNTTYESGDLILANDTLQNSVNANYKSYNQTLAADYGGTIRSYSGNTFENVWVQAPPLSVVPDKSTASIGELITYTINASFEGAPANYVVLTNTIPNGLVYVNYSTTNGDPSFLRTGQNLVFDYGNITEKLVYSIEISAYINETNANNMGGVLTDNVQLVYENSTSGATFTITESTSSTITEPSLTPSKTTSASTINVGSQTTYTLSFTNTGDSTAFNITVNDTLPDGLSYASSTQIPLSQDGRKIIWNIPSLGSSQSWNTIVTVNVDETYESGQYIAAKDRFLNTFNATYFSYNQTIATVYSGTIRNYSDTDSIGNVVRTPTRSINADKNSASIGELITYNIIGNFQNSYADGVTINVTYPSGIVFVNQTNSSNNNYTFSQSGQILTFDFEDLNVRENLDITFTGYINDVESNSAENNLISYLSLYYHNSSDHSFLLTDNDYTTIVEPSNNLQKESSENVVSINETFTYTISFENNGTGTAYNITINDTIPDGIDFVSSTENLESQSNDLLIWIVPLITVDDTWTSIVTARVNETYESGKYILANDTIFNQIGVQYYSENRTLANPYSGTVRTYTDTADETVVINDPIFMLTQSSSTVGLGDLITYTLTSDFTQAPGNEFIVVNNISDKILFVNYSNTTGLRSYTKDDLELTFDYGNLTDRENHGLTINVCVNDTGTVTNNAVFSYENVTGTTFTTTESVSATSGGPTIVLNKTSLVGTHSGVLETVEYLINLTNTGTGTARNVSIIDTYSDGLIFNSVSTNYSSIIEASRTINWNNLTIPAGSSELIYLNLTLNDTYSNGTEVDGGETFLNTANITYQSSESSDCSQFNQYYSASDSVVITSGYIILDVPSLRKVMRTTNFGINSVTKREIKVKDITLGKGLFGTTGNLISKININFTADINFSSITSDTDRSLKKSFVHGLSNVDEIINKTLYIPRVANTSQVYICPGASSLAATTPTCENKVTIGVNQTVNGMTMTEVSTDGEDYYLVTNIAGTGGGEGSAPTLTNDAVNPTSSSFVTYVFNVTYTDAENDVASYVNLELNGLTNYTMIESDESDTNVIDGKSYYYQTNGDLLGAGNHTFKFNAADEANITVNTSSKSGPNVTQISDLDITSNTDSDYITEIELAIFYANYTKYPSGEPINSGGDSGNCLITIPELSITNSQMDFNGTGDNRYNYSTTFPSHGTFNWSVTCSSTSYDAMNSSSNVLIFNSKVPVPEFGITQMIIMMVLIVAVMGYVKKREETN